MKYVLRRYTYRGTISWALFRPKARRPTVIFNVAHDLDYAFPRSLQVIKEQNARNLRAL